MSDLQSTASAFASESKKLAGLIPAGGPPVPDGGSGAIDGAMHSAVSSIGRLNQALAQAMEAHAQKLSKAHANYANNELTLAQVSQDLSSELAPAPPQAHAIGK
jgi:4-aminobutyrate aminotransferase-like enzyme